MKKLYFLLSLFFCLSINAQLIPTQGYYAMTVGEEGNGEYITNLRRIFGQPTGIWGIGFVSGNSVRGFINNKGYWGFLKPNGYWKDDPARFSNYMGGYSDLTFACEGFIYTEGVSVRNLRWNNTTCVNVTATDTQTKIASFSDPDGLHFESNGGHKIYFHDKVYFNKECWTTFGAGKNNDPTINNPNSKLFRIGGKGGIGFWTDGNVESNDTPNMRLGTNGGLSIGTVSNPIYKLNVGGAVFTESDGVKTFFGKDSDKDDAWIGTKSGHGMYLGTSGSSSFYIDTDRNVYIGLIDTEVAVIRAGLKTKYNLFVSKGVLSEDFGISPKSTWSDFVFSKDYNLRSISEVATFISENNHLPDVPSAKEVAEEGYSQHDMNRVLLQKIEELTLYTIQQQKEIEALKAQLQKSE